MVLPHCSGAWGRVPAGAACARITLHEANEPVHQAFLQASWEYRLWKWKVTQRHLCPSSVVTGIFFLRACRKGPFLLSVNYNHLPPIFEPSRCWNVFPNSEAHPSPPICSWTTAENANQNFPLQPGPWQHFSQCQPTESCSKQPAPAAWSWLGWRLWNAAACGSVPLPSPTNKGKAEDCTWTTPFPYTQFTYLHPIYFPWQFPEEVKVCFANRPPQPQSSLPLTLVPSHNPLMTCSMSCSARAGICCL